MSDEEKRIVEDLRRGFDKQNCWQCEIPCDVNRDHCTIGDAVDLIEKLSAELEQLKRERDALKADILRATDKAHEMQSMLDNDVHPNCDYGLYCDLCDALGDVVAWEHKELLDTTPPYDEACEKWEPSQNADSRTVKEDFTMATEWKSQVGGGTYAIQFETDNRDLYKLVEKACQIAMDEAELARLRKEREVGVSELEKTTLDILCGEEEGV